MSTAVDEETTTEGNWEIPPEWNECHMRSALAKKLVEVVKAVGYVQKTGKNIHQNYNYAQEKDVADKFREAMAKQGLVMIPSFQSRQDGEYTTRNGTKGVHAKVIMSYQIIDSETGHCETFSMPGDGMDNPGDKAIYKAITGAQKYAMWKLTMLSTGDDPENDSDEYIAEPESKDTKKKTGSKKTPPVRKDTFQIDQPVTAGVKTLGLLREFTPANGRSPHKFVISIPDGDITCSAFKLPGGLEEGDAYGLVDSQVWFSYEKNGKFCNLVFLEPDIHDDAHGELEDSPVGE